MSSNEQGYQLSCKLRLVNVTKQNLKDGQKSLRNLKLTRFLGFSYT